MRIKMSVVTRLGVAGLALAVSDVGRLLWRLARDPRVDPKVRAGLVAVAAYVISPVDLIPAWVPFARYVDDAIVTVVGIRTLLRRVHEPLILEHWSGDAEVLARILGYDVHVRHA